MPEQQSAEESVVGVGEVLDPSGYKRLNDVRKDVWSGGIRGLVGGLVFGGGGWLVGRNAPVQWKVRPFCTKNTLVGGVLLGGCLGSFLGALVAGKNSVAYIGDIFQSGAKPKSEYQRQRLELERMEMREADVKAQRRQEAIKRTKEEQARTIEKQGGDGSKSF